MPLALSCAQGSRTCTAALTIWLRHLTHTHRQVKLYGTAVRTLLLSASDFSDILERKTRGESLYATAPLGGLNGKLRGDLLAALVRTAAQDIYPHSQFKDPVPGLCVNGSRRCVGRAECDWLQDGRRVECKTGRLSWAGNQWTIRFCDVKFAVGSSGGAFDNLVLGLYTPQALFIYLHDGLLGKSAQGTRTACSGHIVQLRGPRGEATWQLALASILRKLDSPTNSCQRIAEIPLNDHRVETLYQAMSSTTMRAYSRTPLAEGSTAMRGLRIEAVARRVDKMLNPGARADEGNEQVWGHDSTKGGPARRCDWIRDGQRIECKSAQLSWDGRSWKFAFQHVKLGGVIESSFDELLLGLYTPAGLYIYKHDLKLGVSSAGLRTATYGCVIKLAGPHAESDWQKSLAAILEKLDGCCDRLALIEW